jgi:hypothetical protein
MSSAGRLSTSGLPCTFGILISSTRYSSRGEVSHATPLLSARRRSHAASGRQPKEPLEELD